MKIQFASDLHLERNENSEYWENNKIIPIGDVLVLAGDITKLSNISFEHPFFDQISNDFKQVIIVPGNHEYYSISNLSYIKQPDLEIEIRPNVKYYNNKVVKIDDINFICSTLWSHINPIGAYAITQSVKCFSYIKYDKYTITVDKWNELHEDSKYFIINFLFCKSQFNKISNFNSI